MHRIIATAIASIAAIFALGAFSAPTAHADADSYIYALQHSSSAHYTGSKRTFLDVGYRVCTDLAAGYSGPTIVNAVVASPWTDFDYRAANDIVTKAIAWLC